MPDPDSDLEKIKEKGPEKKEEEDYRNYCQATPLWNYLFICNVRVYQLSGVFEQLKRSAIASKLHIQDHSDD